MPGPVGLPFLGNTFSIAQEKRRLTLHKWAQEYGDVYRVRIPHNELVVSGYKYIHHVLVTQGQVFAARKDYFRIKFFDWDSGVLCLPSTNPSWSLVRKVSHRYMSQFGDGIARLENILSRNADYMQQQLDSALIQPVNIMHTLKSTALRSISVLLLGRATSEDDPLWKLLLEYERRVLLVLDKSSSAILVELFPMLIHLPLPICLKWKKFKQFQKYCWEAIKGKQSKAKEESLTQAVLAVVRENSSGSDTKTTATITELEAGISLLMLIFAGTATTARALYCILNVLAFRQDLQARIEKEIIRVLSDGKPAINASDRVRMPYLRATILECLRAFTIVPYGSVPQLSLSDIALPGYGIIPKGTVLRINTWSLHHDKSFWNDPEVIRPERFLDEDGQLLPPDHPNRKHVLPFGAGPRVCLGEVFARTRLFLWTTAVAKRYRITAAPDSDERWLAPTVHLDNMILEPLPNKIVFCKRE